MMSLLHDKTINTAPQMPHPSDVLGTTFNLTIGGFRLRLEISEALLDTIQTAYFAKVCKLCQTVSAPDQEWDLLISVEKKSEAASFSISGKSINGIYYQKLSDDHYIFKSSTSVTTLSFKSRLMQIQVFNDSGVTKIDDIISFYCKVAVSLLTLQGGGIPFHCCAMTRGVEYAFIFSGQSGAGKSTIASLLSDSLLLLNDEFNLILPDPKGRFMVYSTPFISKKRQLPYTTGAAAIKKLFFIKQNTTNALVSMELGHKYRSILSNVYTFLPDPVFATHLFENTENIVSTVSIDMLYFSNAPSRLETLIKTLGL
ncbi:MAG: hypothetical protein JW795_17035 [Chitinivibrionales bacterium]|nr:hypothetical protein [Chitinivibrionales bacterium]